jgi:hypothetical protein
MMATIEPRHAPWHELTVGSTIWVPIGDHGWRAATITRLGKNRAERTIVYLSFESGGNGKRYADQLFWRQPKLKGKDKPAPLKHYQLSKHPQTEGDIELNLNLSNSPAETLFLTREHVQAMFTAVAHLKEAFKTAHGRDGSLEELMKYAARTGDYDPVLEREVKSWREDDDIIH